MRENYGLICEKTLDGIRKSGDTPSLLLHSCCAPCSSYVLEYLSEYFNITLFFYNPNIYPAAEFDYRLEELGRFTRDAGYKTEIISPDYDSGEFFGAVRGYESEREGGARCRVCYELRLKRTAAAAKELGFDYFTTTLSISPYKRADWLNEIGCSLEKEYGIKYLCSDFKKKNGYKRSIELSAEYNLYRQDYCGCVYSKAERDKRSANEE